MPLVPIIKKINYIDFFKNFCIKANTIKKQISKWNYVFYGSYLRPISMFSEFYQADLDSTYKQECSKPIGIGYNFRDKNSNFMIANKQH